MKTTIKYKRTARSKWQRLPFVNSHAKAKAPNWHVPTKGGHFGGYKTGEFMAVALLKYQREQDDAPLPAVVESLMRRFEAEGGSAMLDRPSSEWSESFRAFRGQYCGFFNYLSKWLHYAAATAHGDILDRASEQDIEQGANDGLDFDEKAFMAAVCFGKFWEDEEE
jgi:hypothetical protein